jgi:hypothetical protein
MISRLEAPLEEIRGRVGMCPAQTNLYPPSQTPDGGMGSTPEAGSFAAA